MTDEKLIREMMEAEQSMYCQGCGVVWQHCYDCSTNINIICKICYGAGGYFLHRKLCEVETEEELEYEIFD